MHCSYLKEQQTELHKMYLNIWVSDVQVSIIKKTFLRNIQYFVFLLFLYGFEKLLYNFQENILLNDSKNVMWWNYQLKMYNIFCRLPS